MSAVEVTKKLSEDYAAAHQAGDGPAIARMFCDDGIIIPPGKPAIVGRQAIDEFFANLTGGSNLTTETFHIQVEGAMAHNHGTVSWSENGERRILCYVDIYRLEGGEWKFQLVTWNTNEGIAL
jgi:uncharacterized protein (TIGR02246 family)